MNELPTISSSTYSSSAVSPEIYQGFIQSTTGTGLALPSGTVIFGQQEARKAIVNPNQPLKKEPIMSLRIVRIVIADPNDSLPLEKRVLYHGDEITTDLTDQELYFEIPVKELLDKHNEYRVSTQDKSKKEKTMLEPVRIRDLKMVVVNVAAF